MIGYWPLVNDESAAESGFPDPGDLHGSWDEADRKAVLGRLHAGVPFRTYAGFSSCRICGTPVGAEELTDGVWAWPSGLAHYVEAHGVQLPDEFVRAARADTVLHELAALIGPAEVWLDGGGGSSFPTIPEYSPRVIYEFTAWRDWAAANTPARPAPDAACLDDARTVAAELSHPSWSCTVDNFAGRWRVSFAPDGARTYMQCCSADVLRVILLRLRPPDPDAFLDMADAAAIAEEFDGDWGAARILAERYVDERPVAWFLWIKTPDLDWPTREEIAAATSDIQYGWAIFHPNGAQSRVIAPQDAITWRAVLERIRADAQVRTTER